MSTRTPTRFPIKRARALLDEHGGALPIGPRLYPCVCGHGRHAHAGSTNTGGCKATGCKRYRADQVWELAYSAVDAGAASLGQTLRAGNRMLGEAHRRKNPVLSGQWRISVGDLDSCPRAIQYRNKPPADLVLAWEDKREALMGQIIHDGVEAIMRALYPWREFEQSVPIPGLERESRLDYYDEVIATLGDIKTAGDWRWDKIGDEGPPEDTWDKVYLYALAKREQGFPVETVRLDYLKRCNGHDESFERPYDEQRARDAQDRLLGYAQALDMDWDLPKTRSGPTTDPLCRRCPFRNHCWNIQPAEKAGRSPESYTALGPDPEEQAIAWAISEKVDAAAERLAAEKVEKDRKVLLEGIEPGRYGDFEGYVKGATGNPDHKTHAAVLADELRKPADQQRPPEEIPLPRHASSLSVTWSRVRKATLAREKKEAAALAAEGDG